MSARERGPAAFDEGTGTGGPPGAAADGGASVGAPQRPCACTGVRWCAACRPVDRRAAWGLRDPVPTPSFLAERPVRSGAWPDGSVVHEFDAARQTVAGLPGFTGLVVWPEFVSDAEARALLEAIESRPFAQAQSGKAKQHFGPRMNFRRRRMNPRSFSGLPAFAHEIELRVRARAAVEPLPGLAEALRDYRTTDAFVLRYEEARASNLDLHVDDTFAYGELILDLSLESDGWLTFLDGDPQSGIDRPFTCVRAALPARSMALLFGAARRAWLHGICAADVSGRRTSVTLRTLGCELRSTDEGRGVMASARHVLPGSDAGPLLRPGPASGIRSPGS